MKKIMTLVFVSVLAAPVVSAQVQAELELRANAQATAAEETDNSDTGMEAGYDSSAGAGVTAEEEARLDATATAETQAQVDVESDLDISVVSSQLEADVASGTVVVRGWDPLAKRPVMGPSEVTTSADLKGYVQATVLGDENIKTAAVTSEKIEVTYDTPARFLGIFSTRLKARAVVETGSETSVKVRFPWYGWLYKKYMSAADIEANIASELSANASLTAATQASAQIQAMRFTTVSNVLKTSYAAAIE